MKHVIIFSRLFLVICLTGIVFIAQAQKKNLKKRVAVFLFDDKSDSNFGWYGSKSVGEGISDMIVTELVKSGMYRVIEREQINQLLAEQDMGAAGIVTPETAVEMGKVLGVEIAIMGAVTEFGYKRDDTGVRLGGTRVGVGKQSAVAGIDLRMVNTTTAEIIVAENVRRTKNALAGSFSKGRVGFKNQKSFDQSLVGKVTREAVEDVIKHINKQAPNISWQGKIITVQGDKVYINRGSTDGIAIGDVFKVIRAGEALVDPDTGLNLGSIDQEIGSIKVTDNSVGEGKASICTIVSGANFERNDIIKE